MIEHITLPEKEKLMSPRAQGIGGWRDMNALSSVTSIQSNYRFIIGGIMHQLLIVSSDIHRLADFTEALNICGFEVAWEESGANALQRVQQIRPMLVILDECLEDMTAWEAIQRLLSIDATINTAVVSRLDPEKFHAVSEGLGVMACIPFCPTKLSAIEVIEALKRTSRLNLPNSVRP
jgi:DNA-binding NtrC family response regulator